MSEPAPPCTGIRVIEFIHIVMAPTCGMLLGEHTAALKAANSIA